MKVKLFKRDFTVADKFKVAESSQVADMDFAVFADWLSVYFRNYDEFERSLDFLFDKGFVFVGCYRCELVK